jgi:hypothetical protein
MIVHFELLKFEVVVVLAGQNSEHFLRSSRALERCDLVFDTTNSEASMITQAHAACHATEDAFFLISLMSVLPTPEHLHELIKQYYRAGLRTERHGFWFADFPLLITRSGNQFFRKASGLAGWQDPRLQIITVKSNLLASRVNTL